MDFNPRSPRGERQTSGRPSGHRGDFNPRSPRGERRNGNGRSHWSLRISIHAPRVGSDLEAKEEVPIIPISIHAPRVGSDLRNINLTYSNLTFQSTLPAWGAT